MADGTPHPAPRRTARAQAKIATTQKVLDAALAEFVLGYEKATIRGIAGRAGMSTGAVFASYPNKAALYRAAFGHDPITPEDGREIMAALRKLVFMARTSGGPAGHDRDLDAALMAAERLTGRFPVPMAGDAARG